MVWRVAGAGPAGLVLPLKKGDAGNGGSPLAARPPAAQASMTNMRDGVDAPRRHLRAKVPRTPKINWDRPSRRPCSSYVLPSVLFCPFYVVTPGPALPVRFATRARRHQIDGWATARENHPREPKPRAGRSIHDRGQSDDRTRCRRNSDLPIGGPTESENRFGPKPIARACGSRSVPWRPLPNAGQQLV